MWLMQGVFFWRTAGPGHDLAPEYCPFNGDIWQESGVLTGQTKDKFGDATLLNIVVTKDRVAFDKVYKGREARPIHYEFTIRDGITWVGEYNGKKTGTGVSRCVFVEVGDDFFLPGPMVRLLKRSDVHHY